ncbi:hypothetical protein LQR30_11855 [Chromobacterium piscinae]|uniref:hypothetical protein n=1 Tax=Chromobacterium piscinae TaxID=686831 RepID=UPI001E52CB3A|nr:hypothetical protein [Chromobacterium piscinae]MCD4504800.1 hypothetical protein [Chromobacterium piscinae]
MSFHSFIATQIERFPPGEAAWRLAIDINRAADDDSSAALIVSAVLSTMAFFQASRVKPARFFHFRVNSQLT